MNGSSLWKERIIGVVVILFTLITLFGLNGQVRALESRMDNLARTARRITVLQRQVKDIARLRNDILEAIGEAVRRNGNR